jgi:acetyltransferase-like isoleucine patch superfamily enzyme
VKSSGRRALLLLAAVLPSAVKRLIYGALGYRVDPTARIGFSFIDADECEIGAHTTIGHFNVVIGVKSLSIGDHVRIGHVNLFRGGDEIVIGRYAEIMRRNELNSIPDADPVTDADPRLTIGAGAVITDGHRLDFTDRIEIGRRAIIGGRNSSVWTHNRQRTAPVRVGDFAYVGSEVRMSPGSAVPDRCVVGIGSVITEAITESETLIAGVPARVIKPLTESDLFLVDRKTRNDLPDDV